MSVLNKIKKNSTIKNSGELSKKVLEIPIFAPQGIENVQVIGVKFVPGVGFVLNLQS